MLGTVKYFNLYYMIYNTTNSEKKKKCVCIKCRCVLTHMAEEFIGEPQVVVQGQNRHSLKTDHDDLTQQEAYSQLLEVSLQITMKSFELSHKSRPEPLAQDSLGTSQRWTERHQQAV